MKEYLTIIIPIITTLFLIIGFFVQKAIKDIWSLNDELIGHKKDIDNVTKKISDLKYDPVICNNHDKDIEFIKKEMELISSKADDIQLDINQTKIVNYENGLAVKNMKEKFDDMKVTLNETRDLLNKKVDIMGQTLLEIDKKFNALFLRIKTK